MVRALAVAALLAAQDGTNEVQVNEAIEKGIAFLRRCPSPDFGGYENSDELFLWTFIHARVPATDPKFKELFQNATKSALHRTYKVALLAMSLEEMDRVRYQEKIAQCAQWLVDTQCTNGQWSYGAKLDGLKDPSVGEPAVKDVASGPGGKDAKPKAPTKKITIKKGSAPPLNPETGDNSNSQYAALGLRACHDAGIVIPESTLTAAVKSWKDSMFNEADRGKPKDAKKAVASGGGTAAEGWNYKTAATDPRPPYPAMTAGGLGALVIYAYIQKKDWKNDPAVQAAYKWLTDKFEIDASNAYYMYALERAGILYGTETFGVHSWYREGAYAILKAQHPDGSWSEDAKDPNGLIWYGRTWDTCFSILFLRRATRPLVASGSGR
ncbi:MAG TPA: hypothetical protein VEN81_12445 [Planctomycetota bacterium]|nr:hypothetical protein [Planctomycetota bacterium]